MVSITTPTSLESTYTIRRAQLPDLSFLPNIERSAGEIFRTCPGIETLADDDPMSFEQHQYFWEAGRDWGVGGTWVVVHERAEESEHEQSRSDGGLWQSAKSSDQCEADECVSANGETRVWHHKNPRSPVGGNRDTTGVPQDDVVGFICTSITRRDRSKHTSNSLEEEYLLFINELSVHSSHHRRGLGGRLLNEVIADVIRYKAEFSNQLDVQSEDFHANLVGLALTTFKDVPFNGPYYQKAGFKDLKPHSIEEVIGPSAQALWNREQEAFAQKGGNGRERRCFMVKWIE